MLEQVAESMDDYRGFEEDFLHKTYKIDREPYYETQKDELGKDREVIRYSLRLID